MHVEMGIIQNQEMIEKNSVESFDIRLKMFIENVFRKLLVICDIPDEMSAEKVKFS